MGELILCSQALAKLPYELKDTPLHIYSLEELSYYIEKQMYLLDTEFMDWGLCDWIEKELGLIGTAQKLREICKSKGRLSDFVACILEETGYYTKQEQSRIVSTLQEMEQKSKYECRKMKADRYMENHWYVRAVLEYRKLLQSEEKDAELIGKVWHNLGCAYARLFLFDAAAECFEQAYKRNENPESLWEYLYAYLCGKNEEGFRRAATEYELDGKTLGELLNRLREARKTEDLSPIIEKEGICEQLIGWKTEYLTNYRV
ncbi:MAG: tetratricopeptide repeat protein [Clostridiales bacterium]|nr:tetratricopeptide repeat protein [Clostridiales bacterium]